MLLRMIYFSRLPSSLQTEANARDDCAGAGKHSSARGRHMRTFGMQRGACALHQCCKGKTKRYHRTCSSSHASSHLAALARAPSVVPYTTCWSRRSVRLALGATMAVATRAHRHLGVDLCEFIASRLSPRASSVVGSCVARGVGVRRLRAAARENHSNSR